MDAIIVDMDGTLCDVTGVRHYVTGDNRDFRSFHESSRFCPPRSDVEQAVRLAHSMNIAVVIVTARDTKFERATRDFLARNDIPFDALFMRGWNDQRRDTVVKDEIFHSIIDAGFTPIMAIDDRQDIAAVWESHGIETIIVDSDDAPG